MAVYIYKNNQQSGPYEESAVAEWLKKGQLSPEDMACQQGSSQWQPLKVLFPEFGVAPAIQAPLPVGGQVSAPVANQVSVDKKAGGGCRRLLGALMLAAGLVLFLG